MKRLLVILTGGTIASGWDGTGKAPAANASEKLRLSLSDLFQGRDIDIIFREPLGHPGIDSSEMSPAEWVKITNCIAAELKGGLSGVLILHGTDTMANTAAWLSLCFGSLPIPVVLTGSQLTLDYMPEDVTSNLRGAAMACCSDLKGTWIYFNWKLIPADRAHKAHAMHPDAFTAINGQPLFFNPDWALESGRSSGAVVSSEYLSKETEHVASLDPQKLKARCRDISSYFALPGTKIHLDGRERIICLLGYGAGNMQPSVLSDLEISFAERPKPIIIACSQAEGGMKHPEGYDVVGMARLAKSGFSVWSQIDRSTEFVHSLCCYALAVCPERPQNVLGRFLRECR